MKNAKFRLVFSLLLSTLSISAWASEKLVIVTIDGMRWQEIFGGMDQKLLNDAKYTRGTQGLKNKFQDTDKLIEREKLFPFIWKTIAKEGQIYGNRDQGSLVDVANTTLLSYAGYNELFTGFPDPKIVNNNPTDNPNENIFEYLNKKPGHKGKIAIFASWNTFNNILNEKRNGLLVNTTGDAFNFKGTQFKLLNDLQMLSAQPIGYRPDIFTYGAAREYLKAFRPKVLYIALDETDDTAHYGWYDQYIKSAHANDAMLADLWNTLQSMDEYRGKTTLVVTTDHGRGGIGKPTWMHHGYNEDKSNPVHIPESNQIWMAFMGPGIPVLGEVKNGPKIFQSQMATTLTKILGVEFKPTHEVKEPITSVFK
jgi:hypothetical protein